ncbi:MAG TPA: DUF3180 domain-containing protein [Mycobacteriales bacterium]|nr:DUF3180 domain-containing protein [Mycobacteriales bacterium]
MTATRIRDLVAIALVTGLLSWVVVRRWYGSFPELTWYVPISLGVLAWVELVAGYQLRARIRRRRGARPVNPLVAARMLALAKASSLVGAGMTGVWAGLMIYVVPRLDFLAAASGDTATSSVGVVCSAGLTAAALWLEHCCRTPDPPEDDRRRHDRDGDRH